MIVLFQNCRRKNQVFFCGSMDSQEVLKQILPKNKVEHFDVATCKESSSGLVRSSKEQNKRRKQLLAR